MGGALMWESILLDLGGHLGQLAKWSVLFFAGVWLFKRMRAASYGLRSRFGFLGLTVAWLGTCAGSSMWLVGSGAFMVRVSKLADSTAIWYVLVFDTNVFAPWRYYVGDLARGLLYALAGVFLLLLLRRSIYEELRQEFKLGGGFIGVMLFLAASYVLVNGSLTFLTSLIELGAW